MALTSEGHVITWGPNESGQIGNGQSGGSVFLPVAVNLNGITAIAAGERHSLALTFAFDLLAWGNNESAQLGNRSMANSAIPVLVDKSALPFPRFITAVAAGSAHSVALTSAGGVYTWGSGILGELGQGEFPVNVGVASSVDTNGPLSGVAFGVGAGFRHSLAISAAPILLARRIGPTLLLSWPSALNVHLETAASLPPAGQWTASTDQPVLTGDQKVVTIALSGGLRFYRLESSPLP